MKKVKFQSGSYYTNWVEEDEFTGELKTIPKYYVEGGVIEAEVLKTNGPGTRLQLLLPDGSVIWKKKHFLLDETEEL